MGRPFLEKIPNCFPTCSVPKQSEKTRCLLPGLSCLCLCLPPSLSPSRLPSLSVFS